MYATDFLQVGANIQRQLSAQGMSQQSLATSLQISKQVMHKIVKGTKAINVSELAKIADCLHTTTDALLTIPPDASSQNFLSFMGQITNEDVQEKINMIQSAIDEIYFLEELNNVSGV